MGKKHLKRALVGWIDEPCTVETLLSLALLEQKVIATVPLERKSSTAGFANTLLCAAM